MERTLIISLQITLVANFQGILPDEVRQSKRITELNPEYCFVNIFDV